MGYNPLPSGALAEKIIVLLNNRAGGGGCAGVPRHTQCLALHLVKTMFILEKIWS